MRGVWKCRLRASGRPLGPCPPPGPARPILNTSRKRLFPSVLPVEGPTPHRVLCRYVLMAPVLKSFFIKIHHQHVKTRSFQVTCASECALECRVHGAGALEPGAPPVGEALGGSPIHTGALPGPGRLTASCKPAPSLGFPSTLRVAPERRLCAARSERLLAVCRPQPTLLWGEPGS